MSKLFIVIYNTVCITEDHDFVLWWPVCWVFKMLCLHSIRHCWIPASFSHKSIFLFNHQPQVTFVDWNSNESEADGCYPVWSLSHPLSRAKKSLIHALIFRQDWFYSDINDVQFCGSFNHRHPSNIQQKTPSSATNTALKCCSLQGVQTWIHLQVTLICAQIQQLTSWQWNIRESA